LNLDSSNMVHCKPMILKQSPCQWHLVSCLDQSSTEVPPTLLLASMENVEGWCKELRS
jgi:hypothetical protein